MAVIKIKTIKDNLEAVINYAKNGDKTENGILVSGVNCVPNIAYNQMALAKKFFHKETGRQGYHIIQSFKGREVSPDKANNIGVELAKELFEDKFQAIVCTHVNKNNVHNHIVLNSVSFIDGSKYHNSKLDIALIKNTSDRLCNEYGISVVKTEKAYTTNKVYGKRISKYNKSNEKMLQIKTDVDEAIRHSLTTREFKNILKAKGYEVYEWNMYISVKSPYFPRNIRLDEAFGNEYLYYRIQDKIDYDIKDEKPKNGIRKKYYKKVYIGPKIDRHKLKTSEFYRSHVRRLYALGKLPPKVEYIELTPEYFKQKKEVEEIFEENNFLVRSHITCVQDLENYEENALTKLANLKGERENLWRQYNRATSPEEKYKIKSNINFITTKIDFCSNSLKVYRRFLRRRETLIAETRKLKEIEMDKEQGKNKITRGSMRYF